jgi:predicted nucleic acid-binding protein
VKLLVDINVVLDFLLRRQPWDKDAARLLAEIELGHAHGYLAGHTVTTAHYVTEKALGRQGAITSVSDLLRLFDIVSADKNDFQQALALGLRDFEDAVQAVCGMKVGADFIVTRNVKDFSGLTIPAMPASSVLALL